MKKKTLFLIINAALVLIVGLIFGLTCGNSIFINGAGISAFIWFLITLCLPSVIYLVGGKMTTGGRICSVLFLLTELALSITFMCKPSFGVKAFWIAEAILIGVFLIALLLIIALFKSDDENVKKN